MTREIDENRTFKLESAEWKLKEVLSYLRCLESEENITQNTYNYLDEMITYVLCLIQDELYQDMDY